MDYLAVEVIFIILTQSFLIFFQGDQWDDIKSHLKAGDISKEDYDYLFAAFRSNPWAGLKILRQRNVETNFNFFRFHRQKKVE